MKHPQIVLFVLMRRIHVRLDPGICQKSRSGVIVQQVIVHLSIFLSLLHVQSTMASSSLDAIAQGNANFSRSFLKAVSAEPGNVVSSPISCLLALGMAHAGAKGQTAEIMSKGLFLPSELEVAHQGFKELIHKLTTSEKVELAIANKMYVKNGFSIEPTFSSALEKSFNASAQNVNFLDDATTGIINDWVAQQTKDKIQNLIQSGTFDDMTRLVLINAVYFKGPWLHPFNKDHTSDRDFYTDESNKVQVPFMYQKKRFGYAKLDDLDAQLLELPYEGRELSLVIILPNKRTGLPALEEQLASQQLSELLQRTTNTEVEVYLPKFKVETTLNLNEHLSKMGMEHMFSDGADFSGISTAEPLKISKVIQKAFIEVGEEGTEAAAATAAVIRMKRSAPIFDDPIIFKANHPFAFTLVCNRIDAPTTLFSGRILALQNSQVKKDEL